jgi:hypothetical protein
MSLAILGIVRVEGLIEPGACVSLSACGCGSGNAEDFRGLIILQSNEISEFDQLRRLRFQGGEAF